MGNHDATASSQIHSILLHKECYDTSVIVMPEQFTCKLYGKSICRKYCKNKDIWGLITHTFTTRKCQRNLITIGVCSPAQNQDHQSGSPVFYLTVTLYSEALILAQKNEEQ